MIENRLVTCSLAILAIAILGNRVAAQDLPISMILIEGEDWELVSAGHKFTDHR